MQSELVSRGPLSVLMNAARLQFYHSGVYDPLFGCDPTALDHGGCLEVTRPTHCEVLPVRCDFMQLFYWWDMVHTRSC